MGKTKRAAVLAGQCDEEYQNNFLKGFLKEAFSREFEVCVFSMNRKYMDTPPREASEAHIFDLFVPEDFDAIVFLRDSVQTPGVADMLEEKIHASFKGPVLVIDIKSRYFPSILTDGFEPCYRLVSHLIEDHGFTDIAYITGKRWHEHSIMRLDAYKKAMADHGLKVSEDRIIYGDFWYTSGEVAVDQFLTGRGLPQAVACANDPMAIGLCKALERRGFIVGKDIAVVGFDSCEDGRKSPKPLTSCILPAGENGKYTAEYIDDALMGRQIKKYSAKAEFFRGESCGCKCSMLSEEASIRKEILRSSWDTEIMKEGFNSAYNNMINNILHESELASFLNLVYSYVYQLGDIDNFSLCLCDHWKDVESNPDVVPDEVGMTKRIVRAVSYGNDGSPNKTGTEEIFDRRMLVPQLKRRGKPRAFFFTPLYDENRVFGYGVISYGNRARTYDRSYCRWMNLVGVGFEGLRRNNLIKLYEKTSQTSPAIYTGKAQDILLSPEERQEYDLTAKILDENLLTYNFQPIISVDNKNIYSYEALMRSNTETKISPIKMIKYAGLMGRISDIEKATFLNVLSYMDMSSDYFYGRKIFINSIPGAKLDKETQSSIDYRLEKYSDRVVVELTEESQLSDEELKELHDKYDAMGVWMALDDYGTGYSNVSNLLRYMPKVVKIDRTLLSGIQDKPQKKHFVKDVIDFCHQNNMLALAEGVETAAELQMVIFLGADLIQGFYTGRPSSEPLKDISEELKSEIEKYIREREDGAIRYSYETGKTNRVTLANLMRAGFTDILVKGKNVIYKDISIIGAPGQNTDMFLSIEDGYTGRIDLENVYFTAPTRYQCIELGENVNVTITLKGDNTLRLGGIHVPESSRLTFEGEGNIEIILEKPGFGIGAWDNEKCGRLIFDQDGEIKIVSKGKKGICIGAGLGGSIEIKRGKYVLDCGGTECVGVGFFDGNDHIDIATCLLEIRMSASVSCGIGSIKGNADVFITRSTTSIIGGGDKTAGIGTIYGDLALIRTHNANLEQNVRAYEALCLGAMNGRSELKIESSRLSLSISGEKALVIGGMNGDVKAGIMDSDITITVNNELACMCACSPEDIDIVMQPGRVAILTLCGQSVDTMTAVKKQ
ncbi:MAG: EAL domain-containing protein [Lachnospiraceae bacterium]|nr:EAL domain-containing protein [Lachnospiraceae bacterium]